MKDIPIGAIENGREHFRRLIEHYEFACEAGPLERCADFQEALRCFEVLAEFTATERERCAGIVQEAREGERDTDLRSIIHGIRSGEEAGK